MIADSLAPPEAGAALCERFSHSLAAARVETVPYRHWLLRDVLTGETCQAAAALPFAAPQIGDTRGKRETHNSSRNFYSTENQDRFPVCREFAAAFQDPATVARLAARCEVDLQGSYLRIEYCQDRDGFWLEPHTDIGAKLFTMLIYLSSGPETAGWGTDIFDGDRNHVATAPFEFNCGLIFIPGADTWHGVLRRRFSGIRKSLIVNYVKDEWRARDELAFPDRPVG